MSQTLKTLFALALVSAIEAANEINCPILDCDFVKNTMVPGICYQHDGKVPTKLIRGKQCYDASTASYWETPSFCPFSYWDGQYSWLIEDLQSQEQKNVPEESK
jgi:hypothetical protein